MPAPQQVQDMADTNSTLQLSYHSNSMQQLSQLLPSQYQQQCHTRPAAISYAHHQCGMLPALQAPYHRIRTSSGQAGVTQQTKRPAPACYLAPACCAVCL